MSNATYEPTEDWAPLGALAGSLVGLDLLVFYLAFCRTAGSLRRRALVGNVAATGATYVANFVLALVYWSALTDAHLRHGVCPEGDHRMTNRHMVDAVLAALFFFDVVLIQGGYNLTLFSSVYQGLDADGSGGEGGEGGDGEDDSSGASFVGIMASLKADGSTKMVFVQTGLALLLGFGLGAIYPRIPEGLTEAQAARPCVQGFGDVSFGVAITIVAGVGLMAFVLAILLINLCTLCCCASSAVRDASDSKEEVRAERACDWNTLSLYVTTLGLALSGILVIAASVYAVITELIHLPSINHFALHFRALDLDLTAAPVGADVVLTTRLLVWALLMILLVLRHLPCKGGNKRGKRTGILA